jgi:hypothetical protein
MKYDFASSYLIEYLLMLCLDVWKLSMELELRSIPQIPPFGLRSELICGKSTEFQAPPRRVQID